MINMISGSATAQNLWFPDSGSLYASPSSVQSSSFASTQPSPAMMALKPETKIISPQYAIPNIPTFVSHSYQTQNLQKFVQSAFSAAAEGGIGRIRSANKRPSKPVPDEKKDEAYKERRRKNNDSARRSRELRRRKEDEIQQRNNELERENARLRQEINVLRFEIFQLRQFYGIVGATNVNI
uniref:BZIP domain-containing protein n=1 Tax=Meloidogyne incognita TaxID=6306 RepID=A0A914L7C1_MELIC